MGYAHLKFPFVRKIVLHPFIDFIGVAIILIVAIYNNYQDTFYFQSKVIYLTHNQWIPMMLNGAFPLGFFSIIGSCFSMISTRFTGKQNNIGNIIGVFTALSSGLVDYLLGNHSALVTYPVSFMILIFASKNWTKNIKIRKIDTYYYIIMILGLIIGYILVFLGFYLFGGKDTMLVKNSVAITFGLSIGANICSAFKYEETWLSWIIYNIINLIKNIALLNWANVGKYVFYLINAFFTLIDWKFNKDKDILDLKPV